MALPCHQRHRLGFVDVCIDRYIAAAREIAEAAEKRLAASFRTGRTERPSDARMKRWALEHGTLNELDHIGAFSVRLHGPRQTVLHRGRHDFVPERNRLDARYVSHLQGEYAADADVLIGLQDRVDVLLVVGIDRRE